MAKKKKGTIKRQSIDMSGGATFSPTLKKRKRAMNDDGEGIEATDGDADCPTTTPGSWRSKAVTKLSDFPRNMVKYWYSRHKLLTQYDSGVLLDLESWYSITPEAIAARTAVRCCSFRGSDTTTTVVLDLFCGCGGNAIQFALSPHCSKVIAVDIDPVKVEMAKHNAEIYGVRGKIEFVTADAVEFLNNSPQVGHGSSGIDVVFLSPPWGGVSYASATSTAKSTAADASPVKAANAALPKAFTTTQEAFSANNNDTSAKTQDTYIFYRLASLAPKSGQELFHLARKVSKNVVMYLPRSCDLDEIASLVSSEEIIDVEEQWLGDSFKALCVYFGDVAREWVEQEG